MRFGGFVLGGRGKRFNGVCIGTWIRWDPVADE